MAPVGPLPARTNTEHPTTRTPDHPTTRPPAHPTTRPPTTRPAAQDFIHLAAIGIRVGRKVPGLSKARTRIEGSSCLA